MEQGRSSSAERLFSWQRAAWAVFWLLYAALPLATGAFSIAQFECGSSWGTTLFLYGSAWMGYSGTAVGIGVWQLQPNREERFLSFVGGCVIALLVFLTMPLPWILEKCRGLL